jgi:chromosomal replication initiation ATPase DnaA
MDWIEHYKQVKARISAAQQAALKKMQDEDNERKAAEEARRLAVHAIEQARIEKHNKALLEKFERQRLELLAKLDTKQKHVPQGVVIAKKICAKYDLDWERVRGKERFAFLIPCRQHIMYALREYGLSLPQIGILMNRDHTTILHGYRAHCARHNITQEVTSCAKVTT